MSVKFWNFYAPNMPYIKKKKFYRSEELFRNFSKQRPIFAKTAQNISNALYRLLQIKDYCQSKNTWLIVYFIKIILL
jgi:hypothetical protein